jgi:hypothetical protein
MNLDLLKELYMIYSPSGKEGKMREFITEWVSKNVPDAVIADDGVNLYITKGKSESYPCVVAHMDQVRSHSHSKDFKVIESDGILLGYSPKNRRQEGLGADDKNGIYVALTCLLEDIDNIKLAFFAEEEVGCLGSANCDMEFFKDVKYIIQCDRRGRSDMITNACGTPICSEDFISDVEPETYGYHECDGSLTDVYQLVQNGVGVSCINLSCGYYEPHTDHEITVIDDLNRCTSMVHDLLCSLVHDYPHRNRLSIGNNSKWYEWDFGDIKSGIDDMPDDDYWCMWDEIDDYLYNYSDSEFDDFYTVFRDKYPELAKSELKRIFDDVKSYYE